MMESLINKQMKNIEKIYEQIPQGETLRFGKGAIESIHQVLRELKEYKDLCLTPTQIQEIDKLYAEKCKEVAELKAEIEKLKQNIVDSTNDTYSLQELDHKLLTKEIEQLKAELEQSVKLPCKVGDTVYWISYFKSGIIQGKVSGILISGFGFDLKITDATGMTITKEFEKVFLTREEAEKALAEMEKKKMSKFDYSGFSGGYDSLAVSKEKFTKKEAIEIAKIEIAMCIESRKTMPYIAIGNAYVRHRAGMSEDNEPCVGWWLEYEPHKRSCPCWVFHNAKSVDEFKNSEYEYINALEER